MKQSHAIGTGRKEQIMIQVKCITGDTEYIENELSSMLSEGWEIISIDTAIYESYGTLKRDTAVYLKKSN